MITRSKAQLPEGIYERYNFDPQIFKIRAFLKKRRLNYSFLEKIFYQFWIRYASKKITPIINTKKYDCLFHCTYGSILQGTCLSKSNIPFVFCGGGVEETPLALKRYRGIVDILRDLRVKTFNPPISGALYLVPNTNCIDWLKAKNQKYFEIIPDAIPKISSFTSRSKDDDSEIVNIAYVNTYNLKKRGRHILEKALKNFQPQKIRIHVFGYSFLSDKYFIVNHGKLNKSDFHAKLLNMSYFVLPSYREAVSTSLLEGLGMGLRIICFKKVGIYNLIPESSRVLVESKNGDGAENLKKILTAIDKDTIYKKSVNNEEILVFFNKYYGEGRKKLIRKAFEDYLASYKNS